MFALNLNFCSINVFKLYLPNQQLQTKYSLNQSNYATKKATNLFY